MPDITQKERARQRSKEATLDGRNALAQRKYKERVRIERAGRSPSPACEICGRAFVDVNHRRAYFDHNHDTGAFRGWLCNPCNTAIGLMGESPDVLRAAARYLHDRGCRGQDTER